MLAFANNILSALKPFAQLYNIIFHTNVTTTCLCICMLMSSSSEWSLDRNATVLLKRIGASKMHPHVSPPCGCNHYPCNYNMIVTPQVPGYPPHLERFHQESYVSLPTCSGAPWSSSMPSWPPATRSCKNPPSWDGESPVCNSDALPRLLRLPSESWNFAPPFLVGACGQEGKLLGPSSVSSLHERTLPGTAGAHSLLEHFCLSTNVPGGISSTGPTVLHTFVGPYDIQHMLAEVYVLVDMFSVPTNVHAQTSRRLLCIFLVLAAGTHSSASSSLSCSSASS